MSKSITIQAIIRFFDKPEQYRFANDMQKSEVRSWQIFKKISLNIGTLQKFQESG